MTSTFLEVSPPTSPKEKKRLQVIFLTYIQKDKKL